MLRISRKTLEALNFLEIGLNKQLLINSRIQNSY